MRTEYWAAEPIDKIGKEIDSKFREYKSWVTSTGYGERIRSCYEAFYSFDQKGTLRLERDDQDLIEINVNHYRSLIKRLHILVTENKLAFQAQASTSDSKSQVEADLGRGICEYYGEAKKMNHKLSSAVLGALIMLEQFVHCPWDENEGYELSVGGQIVRSGDQSFEVYSAFDVAKDTVSTDGSPWHIVRRKVNKFDLAALNERFKDEILRSSLDLDERQATVYEWQKRGMDQKTEDYTHEYVFYHSRTASMPEGREVHVCATQVLSDGPLQYSKVPVFRLSAGDVLQTSFADSPAIDLLPVQEALNAMMKGVITNNLTNCVQMIYSPDPNLTTRKLETGQILVTAAQPPVGINLTNSGGEAYKAIEMLMQHEQLLSGVNDVARGNPNASLKSGTSLALVLAQAIQYVSDLQKNYALLGGEVGTMVVDNIRKFASEEMTAYIVGQNREGQIRKFRAADVMDIDRITVQLQNPIMQTVGGRKELASEWAQFGIITDPKQMASFINTGNLDQFSEDPFSDALTIRDENEMLKRGQTPKALLLDVHPEHIVKHKAIFSTPQAREDPGLVARTLAHIQEHINLERQMPPDLKAILSGQPLPPPGQAPGAPAPDRLNGIPPGPPPPPSGAPEVAGANMPQMPEGLPPEAVAQYQQYLEAMPQRQGAVTQ